MNWLRVPIKKVADVESGFGFPRDCQGIMDAEIPFYKVGDMNLPGNESEMIVTANTISREVMRKLRARAFPAGAVIFPKIGAAIATNKKRILTKPSVVDNNVMAMIPKDGIEPWYLFYWMQQFDLRTVSNIGPVPSMRKSEVQEVEMPLPTVTEQRRIIDILKQADALRKQRIEVNGKSERIQSALFYKMFGDPATNSQKWPVKAFDEVFADRTAQFPKLQRSQYQEVGEFPVVDQGKELVAGFSDDEEFVVRIKHPVVVFGDHTRIVKYIDFDFIAGADGSRVFFTKKDFSPAFMATQLQILPIPNLGYSRHMREVKRLQFIAPPISLQNVYAKISDRIRPLQDSQVRATSDVDRIWRVLLRAAFAGNLTAKWRKSQMKALLQEMENQARALGCK